MNILADATLPFLSDLFPKPFDLAFYHDENEIPALLTDKHILLCRSTLKVTPELLEKHSLNVVATASSGIDHINTTFLSAKKIKLLDAKGANAYSVADYVLATLAWLTKNKAFQGKKVGIIGVGHVGSIVMNCLREINMEVIGYDPLRNDSDFQSCSLSELSTCDMLCIHANLHSNSAYPSKNLLNDSFLKQLQPRTIIINTSRGGIIDETALLNYSQLVYCTDVYLNEPQINPKIINFSTLCTPHIAGHSLEAKYTTIALLSQKLHAYYGYEPSKSLFNLNNTNSPLPQNWSTQILSIFNPLDDTLKLKNTSNLLETFLDLRAQHRRTTYLSRI